MDSLLNSLKFGISVKTHFLIPLLVWVPFPGHLRKYLLKSSIPQRNALIHSLPELRQQCHIPIKNSAIDMSPPVYRDDNKAVKISNGIGIFSGPASEKDIHSGDQLFLILFVGITTIAIVIPYVIHGSVTAYIPAALSGLITYFFAKPFGVLS